MAEFKDKSITLHRLLNPGIVAIVRTQSPDGILEAAHALLQGGISALEITLTTPGALQILRELDRAFGDKILLGSGSVTTSEAALETIKAGARFVVTPVTRPGIVKTCLEAGVVIACGAYTPTEALTAHESGADFVKIFPAEGLGVKYIKSILGPLPQLRIIPTGGVDVNNCADFIKAGCAAVAVGSNLVSTDVIQDKNWKLLTERAQAYVDALKR